MTETPIDRFIEEMGLCAQTDGAPRIAGRILGYLLVEGEARTLRQMSQALKISKASASTNARLLELRGMVRRVSPAGKRGDAYQALDMPNTATIRAQAQSYRERAEIIAALAAEFPPSHDAAQVRIGHFAGFYRDTAAFIDAWMDSLGPPTHTPAARDEE